MKRMPLYVAVHEVAHAAATHLLGSSNYAVHHRCRWQAPQHPQGLADDRSRRLLRGRVPLQLQDQVAATASRAGSGGSPSARSAPRGSLKPARRRVMRSPWSARAFFLDPGARRAAVRPPDTVAVIAARFIEEYARPRNRSWGETERIFRAYVSPAWGGRDIASITRRDVRELLESVARDHGGVMSNRVLSAVRKLLAWALERDIVSVNPALGTHPVAKEVSRDRVLSDAELQAFWQAAADLAQPWQSFFRVLALTGQRLGEVAAMRWADVDLDRALWTLPASLNKSGRLHEVPLSTPVMGILRAERRRSGPHVFTTGDGSKPIAAFAGPKEALVKAMETTARWTLHDLYAGPLPPHRCPARHRSARGREVPQPLGRHHPRCRCGLQSRRLRCGEAPCARCVGAAPDRGASAQSGGATC